MVERRLMEFAEPARVFHGDANDEESRKAISANR